MFWTKNICECYVETWKESIITFEMLQYAYSYCHVYECGYWRVLDWWSDLLDFFIQRMTTLYTSLLHTHTMSTITSLPAVARYRLSTEDVSLLLSSRTIPGLGYQLLAATAHNDWAPAVLWLTSSSTDTTPLIWITVLLITYRYGPHRKHRYSVAVYGPLPSNGCLVICFTVVA
jgi:hypothetical protein